MTRANWLLLLLLLLLSLGPQKIVAQSGFISLDCGSGTTKNYTDNSGITWSSDDSYIISGYKSGTVVTWQGSWYNQFFSFRYFNETRSKFCYELPTESNRTYLIRAGFLWGNFTDFDKREISFDLTVDTTLWAKVKLSAVNSPRSELVDGVTSPLIREIVVSSTSSLVNVCLIPIKGHPFISSLELRPLADDIYPDAKRNKVLVNQWRWSAARCCSSSPRYPIDPFDRIWYEYGNNLETGNEFVRSHVIIENFDASTDAIENTTFLAPITDSNQPPVEVMMDAWAFNGTAVISQPIEGKSDEYYIAIYFQELTAGSTSRDFSLLLNGELLEELSVNTKGLVYTALKVIPGLRANFTLLKTASSILNPIVNAMEMFAVLDVNMSSTYLEDVASLNAIRTTLGLIEWAGDPCYPVPWEWLSCSDAQPSRVTQVKLSNLGLGGSIPIEFSNLSELTDLWLDTNFLKGQIPNLSSLHKLKTLHLQNNNLTGFLSPSFADLPVLQELYVDNNTLTGEVPQSILKLDSSNDRNFTFTYAGNTFCNPEDKLCIRTDPNAPASAQESHGSQIGVIIGAVIGGILGLVLLVVVIVVVVRRHRKGSTIQKLKASQEIYSQAVDFGEMKQARPYSYKEVEKITSNFQQVLGEGSFGKVYLGKLTDGQTVAVKVNSANSDQGAAEFVNEVVLLSRVHHKYLVSLIGYCEEANQQVLIYVYVPNGSLGDHLHGKVAVEFPLTWTRRLEIALTSAQGLHYLHTFCQPPIIHRDVKPNNILLDEYMVAKVADFGLSKSVLEGSQTGVSTAIKGTHGYLDPEYFSGMRRLNPKSDVYSFGAVLLELVTGKKPLSRQRLEEGTECFMIEWTRQLAKNGDIATLVDPAVGSEYNVEAVWRVLELAFACIRPLGVNRPDMGEIVQGLIEIQRLEGSNSSTGVTRRIPSHGSVVGVEAGESEQPLRDHVGSTTATWDSEFSSAYNPR